MDTQAAHFNYEGLTMKFPKLPHVIHWRILLIGLGILALPSLAFNTIHWWNSSPYVTENENSYRLRINADAQSNNVTVKHDILSRQLKVEISYNGTQPQLKLTLPKQTWGIPQGHRMKIRG